MRAAAARPPSDVDVLAGTIFLLAGALATNPLLHAVSGGEDATTLLARLAPSPTMDRLWVVFVLIPAVVTFVGIGVPYAFRVLVALLRRRLATEQLTTTLVLAICAALVVADVAMQRSGLLPLTLTCAVAAWRAGAAFALRGERSAPTLLAIAGIAVLGVAYYQHALESGAAASVAIAPTLVLVALYSALGGTIGALLGAIASRASLWLGSTAGLVGVAWSAGLRVLPHFGNGAETAEVLVTGATGAALIALALLARRASA